MRIEISQRLRPFTHRPGMTSLLPGTGEKIAVYPTMIKDQCLPVSGPVNGFTHQLDLEKGCICIYGHAKEGFFRDCVPPHPSLPIVDRLFLGVDKAQDWDLIHRRADPAEYLPFWYRLGQMVPNHQATTGTAVFLQEWRQHIQAKDRIAVLDPVKNLFSCGFEGILTPRLEDTDHHGFALPPIQSKDNPLALLSEGAKLIRELFVSTNEQELHLLPVLPPEFHCGRLVGTATGPLTLSLEWSKKLIRRMIITTEIAGEWALQFQNPLQSFRLRHSPGDRGHRVECGSFLTLEPGVEYLFDCFEK